MATQLVSRPIETDLPDFTDLPVKKKAPEREIWVYCLTIAGCFAVVWGHVAADVFVNGSTPFQWWVGNISDSLIGWCMTGFIMATGYLLLNPAKQYTYTEFYKKRASRILAPLLFWAFFYSGLTAVRHFSNGVPVTFGSFFTPILTGHPYYHLWYLYMLAGLYLLTPVLRSVMNNLSQRLLVVVCAGLFVIPITVNAYCWFVLKTNFINSYPFIVWPVYFLGYYLAGYLVGKKTRIETKTHVLLIALLSAIAVTVLGGYILKEKYSPFAGFYFSSPLSPNLVCMTLVFFMLVKKLAAPIRQNKYLETGYTLAFGVFLIHPFWIFLLGYLGLAAIKINPALGVPLVSITALGLSLITAIIFKKIPYVRKVI
jgi:surface polysaccharide O-acyltransferase-like enzyme